MYLVSKGLRMVTVWVVSVTQIVPFSLQSFVSLVARVSDSPFSIWCASLSDTMAMTSDSLTP